VRDKKVQTFLVGGEKKRKSSNLPGGRGKETKKFKPSWAGRDKVRKNLNLPGGQN